MSRHLYQDLTGEIFGLYQVERRAPDQIYFDRKGNKQTRVMWECICLKCGKHKNVRGQHLKEGRIRSCGCAKGELSADKTRARGESHTKLYYICHDMKNRCYNEKVPCYERYGGRGITVCDEWRNSYISFRDWCFNNGYNPNAEHMQCQLDRINNNGPYSPDNCRFVTAKENCNNRRKPKKRCIEQITVFNLTLRRYEWAELLNVSPYKIDARPKVLNVSQSVYITYLICRRSNAIKIISVTRHYNSQTASDKIYEAAKTLRLDTMSSNEMLSYLYSLQEKQDKKAAG